MNTKNITRSALTMSVVILLSNITGLIRDSSYSGAWSVNEIALSAFFTAFTIPNLFRSIFGEGAFSQAFIPCFNSRLVKDGKDKSWDSACEIITYMMTVLGVVIFVASLICFTLHVFVPEDNLNFRRILEYTPRLLPYALCVCLVAAFSSVLNSFKHFALPGLNQVIYNITIVLVVKFFCVGKSADDGISILIMAVLFVGVLQVLVQGALCYFYEKKVFIPKFALLNPHPDVAEVRTLMMPVLLSSCVSQINTVIDRFFANIIGPMAVNCIYFSHQLVHLPIGLFAVGMSQVCLPSLSKACSKNNQEEINQTFNTAICQVLFFTLPSVALIIGNGEDLIRLLFQHGKFSEESVRVCYGILICYLPAIPAYSLLKIFAVGFYSTKNTKTPMVVSICCTAINIFLNILFNQPFQQNGLAMATSISAMINAATLYFIIHKNQAFDFSINWRAPLKIFFGAIICAIVIYGFSNNIMIDKLLLEISFLPQNKSLALQRILCSILIGGVAYVLSIILVGGYKDCLRNLLSGLRR